MRRTIPMIAFLVVSLLGCGNGDRPAEPQQAAVDLDPEDPSILVRPFTAEEIRDEWVPGLRLLIRRGAPEEPKIERWTVVSADDEGAEIEYATIGEDGSVVGEARVSRSGWTELRDHAAFPAAYSSREWVRRSTPLGDFEGWLYRVADPSTTVVQEFFFVPSLPGAPVQMRIYEDRELVFVLEQIERLHLDSASIGG